MTSTAAAAAYRRAALFDPHLVPAVVNLANIYYERDELVEAEALYEKAIRLDPECFEAYFNLGNIHHDLARYPEALSAYRDALAINPTYPEAHFYLAVTLEKLGRSAEARPHWRDTGRSRPTASLWRWPRSFRTDRGRERDQLRTASYLERFPEPGGPAERIPLVTLPFTIGRAETADHTIYSNKVSKEHAAIVVIGGRVAVRDLDSTNGTFVNGRRVGEQILADGDIIHVAHVEFCFRQQPAAPRRDRGRRGGRPIAAHVMVPAESPDSMIRGTRLIRDLIATEAVDIVFQPIVDLQSRRVVAYEALGRGAHPELTPSPAPLFRLAEQCGLARRTQPAVCAARR